MRLIAPSPHVDAGDGRNPATWCPRVAGFLPMVFVRTYSGGGGCPDARGSVRGGECLDAIRPEPGPVVTIGQNDRCLLVAERLDGLESLGVEAQIDDLVLETVLVQRTVGGRALHAVRLAKDGDAHVFPLIDARTASRAVTTRVVFVTGPRASRVPDTTPSGHRYEVPPHVVLNGVSAHRRWMRFPHPCG